MLHQLHPHPGEDDDDGLALLAFEDEADLRELGDRKAQQLPSRSAKILRRALIVVVAVVATMGLCFQALAYAIERGFHSSDRSTLAGVIGLMDPSSWNKSTPYRQVAACPDNLEVCICSDDYAKSTATDSFVFKQGSVACKTFRFQVGDSIFFHKPVGGGFTQAEMVAKFTNSPIVHAGMISYVPPEQVDGQQNPDEIIVVEALKGDFKRVTRQTLRHVIQRWPFGAYSIRRVDPKFVHFKEHYADMTAYLNSIVGQPFDPDMVNPTKRHWDTNYINPSISCQERARAAAMFKNGGPGKWMCAQVILWTLAFAGGLNTDYENPYDECPGPGWPLTNMQEYPGALMNEANIWNPNIQFHIPCSAVGCWVGAPTSARWQGGHPPPAVAAVAPTIPSTPAVVVTPVVTTSAATTAVPSTKPTDLQPSFSVTVPVSALMPPSTTAKLVTMLNSMTRQ